MGTIDEDDMDFYKQVYTEEVSGNKWVYINYNWNEDNNNAPLIRLTDPYGIAWDEDLFYPVDDSDSSKTYWETDSGTYSESSGIAYTADSGCGWNTDIKYSVNGGKVVTDNYGYGAIELALKDPDSSGTSQIHANYTHVYDTGSIGLGFKGISVSFNGSASSDSVGTFKTFSY